MDIDIYTSTTRDTYVCVPAGTTPPAHTGAVAKWKTITLHPTDNRIAMDASQVLADIAKQGFAIISGGVDIGQGKRSACLHPQACHLRRWNP